MGVETEGPFDKQQRRVSAKATRSERELQYMYLELQLAVRIRSNSRRNLLLNIAEFSNEK
jgi:hypothetical protein